MSKGKDDQELTIRYAILFYPGLYIYAPRTHLTLTRVKR